MFKQHRSLTALLFESQKHDVNSLFIRSGNHPENRKRGEEEEENEEKEDLHKFFQPVESTHSKNSIYGSMKSVIFIAQCFGMMTVQGFYSKDSSQLRFRWRSLRAIYSIVVICGSIVLCCFAAYDVAHLDITFQNTSGLVFHTSTTVILIFFLYFTTRWPSLIHQWETVEKKIAHYGHPSRVALKIKIITYLILITALVEHLLSNAKVLHHSLNCNPNEYWFREFAKESASFVYIYTPYHILLELFIIVIRILETFSWNFLDLFIIAISFALSERFRQINEKLLNLEGKSNIGDRIWRQFRLDYNALSRLTKILDKEISKFILLSFGNNLYFICLQLLNTIDLSNSSTFNNLDDTVYFLWSFIFLILRASLVSLFGSRIHDQSLGPARTLYSVPPENYSKEVERFIVQVTTDHISLTGMRFFSLTRNLLLSITATIITYEIILLQLYNKDTQNEINTDIMNKTNNTYHC